MSVEIKIPRGRRISVADFLKRNLDWQGNGDSGSVVFSKDVPVILEERRSHQIRGFLAGCNPVDVIITLAPGQGTDPHKSGWHRINHGELVFPEQD